MRRRGVRVEERGFEEFTKTWERQRELVDQIADGGQERLLIVEHPHVITLGRGTRPENVLSDRVQAVEIERGGDATYHGPGQLVAYPLLRLSERGLGIHSYLRRLEDVVIATLAPLGLRAGRRERRTGVWIDGRKIASIGIAVRRGVGYHGLALNVSTDLDYFRLINPCGMDAGVMTSVQAETSSAPSMDNVASGLVDAFVEAFDGSRPGATEMTRAATSPTRLL